MPAPADAIPSALDRAVDRYLRHVTIERGLSANTVAAYRRDLAAYLAFLEAASIQEPQAITAASSPTSAPRCAAAPKSP